VAITSHLAVSGFGQLASFRSFRSLRSLHYASHPPATAAYAFSVTGNKN